MAGEITILLAFAAGVLSFLSPCVLPLIPSYLSFVSGVSFNELATGGGVRVQILRRTVFFVAGFSFVFVVLGLIVSGPALMISGASRWIDWVAGGIVIALGINVMFDLVSVLNIERRMHVSKRPVNDLGATLVGMAFGAGWSPCIGPILASILLLAGTGGSLTRAALLLAVYSLGLGLPFLLTGAAFGRVSRHLAHIKRYFGAIRIGSGLFLVVLGVLIMFGRFQQLNGLLISWGYRLEAWSAANLLRARLLLAGVTAVLGTLPLVVRALRHRRPLLRTPHVVLAGVTLLVALLTITGRLDLPGLIASWLRYQGI